VADAQVWTVIALLAAAIFAIVIEMRRLSDRMSDGFQTVHREFGELKAEFGQLRGEFGELRGEFGELRGEFQALRADVRSDIADLRTDLRWHVGHDHGPPA
jgi:methyl-accepting chemotaxis protein